MQTYDKFANGGFPDVYLIFSSEYIKEFARYLATTLQGRDESTLIRKTTLKSYIMTFIALLDPP